MRGLPRSVRLMAGVASVAIVATACGGSDNGGGGGGSSGSSAKGTVTIGNCKPQNPLIPTNTNEVCGGNVIDAMFTGLVNYDPKDAAPVNAVAKSITTSDNVNFDIKLNDGWKFSDGTPVTAKSFVDAWNWGAYGPNAQLNSYFFGVIDGFADVQGTDKNGDEKITPAEVKTKKMKGLTVVSDTEFKVKLSSPSSVFPIMVGYTAFSPLPASFYKNPKAFGTKPVGNGPFKLDSGNGDTGYNMSAVADYKGPDKPKVAKIVYKSYQSPESEYADLLSDNVDFVQQVPPSALAGGKYKQDLGNRASDKAVGVIQTATVPIYDKQFKDPNFAKAISMAINRKLIIQQIYDGGRQPATGWVSPVVNGYKPGACGQYCNYDPAKAKQLLDKAGGFKGTLTYAYNADGAGNKEAADAICNSIKNALSIDCRGKSYVDFDTLRTDVVARKMTGMFRTGWQMDYPSIENFLAPIFKTGASSNDGDYSNPEFDKLLNEAAAQTDAAQANAKYQQAEALLASGMPAIPMWYSTATFGWSDKVTGVKITAFGTIDFSSLALK
jgi:oligopeptide transport system substrate-binding protein